MFKVINGIGIYLVESNMGYPFQGNYSREDMIFFDVSSYSKSYNKVLLSVGYEILDINELKEKIETSKETNFRNDDVKKKYLEYFEKVLLKMIIYDRDEKIRNIIEKSNLDTLILAC
jgi:hypothetical protein